MTIEEFKLRMGIDTAPMANGRASVKRELDKIASSAKGTQTVMSAFGEVGKNSFLKMEGAGGKFRTLLNNIAGQSPVLGNALRLALSPAIGMFVAIGSATAALKSYIDKLNASLDTMRDKNAQAFGNMAAAAKAAAAEVKSAAKEKQEFEAGIRNAGKSPSDMVGMSMGVVESGVSGAKQTAAKRQVLEAERAMLERKAMEADRTLQVLEKRGSDESKKRAIKNARDQAAELTREIEALKSKMPGLAEGATEAEMEASKGNAFKVLYERLKAGGGSQSQVEIEYEQASASLKQYESLLKKTEESLKSLTDSDTANTEAIKSKRNEIKGLIDAMKKADAELGKLPAATTPPVVTPGSGIDPITGGIAYRGIASRGGIAYRPLRGAPGYTAPAPAAGPTEAQEAAKRAQLVYDVLTTVQAYLSRDGIPVTPGGTE